MHKLLKDRIRLIRGIEKSREQFDGANIERLNIMLNMIREDKDQHFLSISQDDPTRISYANRPEHKLSLTARSKTSFGRYARRQLGTDMSDTAMQKLGGLIVAHTLGDTVDDLANVVCGEKIMLAYLNAVGETSCMTGECHEYCQMYADNPDKVNMLIWDGDERGATARALIWHTDEGETILDRIYPCGHHHQDAIMQWAHKQGMKSVYNRVNIDGMSAGNDEHNITLSVNGIDKFPYMDSMTYGKFHYSATNGGEMLVMSNVSHSDEAESSEWHVFESTEGIRPGSQWCNRCEAYVSAQSMTSVDGCDTCNSCVEHHCTTCENCEETTHNNNIERVTNSCDGEVMDWCSCCASNSASTCDSCGERVEDEGTSTINDETQCYSCAEALEHEPCDSCGEEYTEENLVEADNGLNLCSGCEWSRKRKKEIREARWKEAKEAKEAAETAAAAREMDSEGRVEHTLIANANYATCNAYRVSIGGLMNEGKEAPPLHTCAEAPTRIPLFINNQWVWPEAYQMA